MKINYQKETKSNFQLRNSSKLQKALMDYFSKSSFSFNNQQVFVNVVYVDLSKDMMNAKVVINTFGLDEKHRKELIKKFNKDLSKQIRGIISQKMQIRKVPELLFYLEDDDSKQNKVLDLMEKEEEFFESNEG